MVENQCLVQIPGVPTLSTQLYRRTLASVHRRFAGLGVIALALLSVLTVTSLTAPPKGGEPVRSLPDAPPTIGSCGLLTGAAVALRDCAALHTVEVVSSWRPGEPESGVPTFGSCAESAREYVGSPPAQDAAAHQFGTWSLPLRYRQFVVSGPNGTNLPDWSWLLCLVAPMGPAPWVGYTGVMRSMPPTGPASAALRPCFADDEVDIVVVACTAPHLGEIVATQRVPAASGSVDGSTSEARRASCATEAALLTGSSDPTYSGALRWTFCRGRALNGWRRSARTPVPSTPPTGHRTG